MITATMEQTADLLAKAHAEAEQDILEIYIAPDNDEIRLIEVAGTVGTTNEILPFSFDPKPDKGIDFPLSIVMVSADEMLSIKNEELALPEGWGTQDKLQKIYREPAEDPVH